MYQQGDRMKYFLLVCLFLSIGCSNSGYSVDAKATAAPDEQEQSPLANADMTGINMKSSISDCGFFSYQANGFRGITAWGFAIEDSFDTSTNLFKYTGFDGAYTSALGHLEMNPASVTADVICTDASNNVIAFKTVGDLTARSHLTTAQKIRVINEILFNFSAISGAQLSEYSNGVPMPEMPLGWMNM